MKSANRIFLNTIVLYARMILTMGIALYTTRVILNALGSVDYGIYNLIAGIIVMLSFLNTAMTASTQRFLSYHQGKDDLDMQKKIFSNSLYLHIVIGIIIVIALEIMGLILFNGTLNIPAERIPTAKIIYHFMSLTVFLTVIEVPFTGSLNAHENMVWIACVNIIEALLKLGIASLLIVIKTDKLELYGLLTACITFFTFTLYSTYCIIKFDECSFKRLWANVERKLLKELSSFAGWNLFGSLCGLARTQGMTVLLNVFLGTVVNAAYGVANQVTGQLNFFSLTMLQALNPQIMKSEGAGDRKRMLRLSMMASKFGFFLLSVIAIPCIFEMDSILKFWLKNVPQFTLIFCRLTLVSAMANQLTIGLQSAFQATGKIKIYQILVGSLILCNIPISYFVLKLGYPAYYTLAFIVLIESTACCLRVLLLKKIAGLSIKEFFSRVIIRELIPLALLILNAYLITTFMHIAHFRFLLTIGASVIISIVSIYFFGLCSDEKEMINSFIVKMKYKFGIQKKLNLV